MTICKIETFITYNKSMNISNSSFAKFESRLYEGSLYVTEYLCEV